MFLETEDVYSLIARVRSLEPVASETPQRDPSMLMQFIGNVRAIPAAPWDIDKTDPVQRSQLPLVRLGMGQPPPPPWLISRNPSLGVVRGGPLQLKHHKFGLGLAHCVSKELS